jgi:predicted Fe-Mo cluster-binding NifX family protein
MRARVRTRRAFTQSDFMKVAIAKEGAAVSEHFGHCEAYAVYSIENNRAVWQEDLENPGHSPGFLPVYLAERSIDTVIAGGMGPRAADLFCQNGIEVVLGVHGPVADVARTFAEGGLVGGTSVCNHDHCTGDCGSH